MSTVTKYRETMEVLGAIDADQVFSYWTKPTSGARACFGSDWSRLSAARPEVAGKRTLVYLSYENPKGASGGVLAVNRRLPAEVQRCLQRSGQESSIGLVRLSPHHVNLKTKYAPQDLKSVATCLVPFGSREVKVTIYEVLNSQSEHWYLFGAEGFFEADGGVGGTDPYVYSHEDQKR